MELTGLKTSFASKLDKKTVDLKESEERVMLLEKQVTFLSNSEANSVATALDNRLLQKAGLVGDGGKVDMDENADLPDSQQGAHSSSSIMHSFAFVDIDQSDLPDSQTMMHPRPQVPIMFPCPKYPGWGKYL